MGSLFSPPATARPVDPSLAEMITMRQGPRQHPAQQEAPLTRDQVMAGTQAGLELMPIIGDAIAARDAYRSGKDAFEDFAEGRLGSGAANAGMAGLSALGALPFIPHLAGIIKAYHGSPHRFSKFSMDKIGTGEGAQAYGHGLYFAESPDVAKHYLSAGRVGHIGSRQSQIVQNALSASPDGKSARDLIHQQAMDLPAAQRQPYFDAYNNFDELSASGPSQNFYEVTLQPDHDDLLDWDAPLSEQSPKVREALAPHLASLKERMVQEASSWGTPSASELDGYSRQADEIIGSMNGQQIYNKLIEQAPPTGDLGSPGDFKAAEKWASQALNSASIPGIRYLDAGSRSKKDGTRNIVLFDDNLVSIDRVE